MAASRGGAPFHIGARRADARSGQIELGYYFEGEEPFVEEVDFGPIDDDQHDAGADDVRFQAAARLLHLVAGTSYYKSQAPTTIVVDEPTGITPAEAELVRAVHDEGLREFATRNDLEIPLVTTLKFQIRPGAEAPAGPTTEDARDRGLGRPLIPFGGGKDSTLVQHLLPEAEPVTINPVSTHHAVARALGKDLLTIRRRIARVDELTRPDRLNGHVPITAIVSALALTFAAQRGFTSVVMANERSASEPTLWTDDGKPVNHQYSKSAAFEQRFQAAIDQAGIDIDYFSLLRDLSEADVARHLAPLTTVLPVLLSCNNAFTGSGTGTGGTEAAQRWCGRCPKCQFSYLMLAPHVDPETLAGVFGEDLLAVGELTAEFAHLWDPDAKPWECVGERREAAEAMHALAASDRWRDHAVVRALASSAAVARADSPAAGPIDSGVTSIPPAFLHRLPT